MLISQLRIPILMATHTLEVDDRDLAAVAEALDRNRRERGFAEAMMRGAQGIQEGYLGDARRHRNSAGACLVSARIYASTGKRGWVPALLLYARVRYHMFMQGSAESSAATAPLKFLGGAGGL